MVEPKSRAVSALPSGAYSAQSTFLNERLSRKLQEGLESLGLSLAENQKELLIKYLALLVQWNAIYNLTSVRDPMDMLALHVLDSLSIVDLVLGTEALDVLDVGTGAGLPGVPLAIALPRLSIRLVDAVAKKISFLRQVRTALKLPNIIPQHARIEALTLDKKPVAIVSRAYANLTEMILSVDHLADRSTTIVAMKGTIPSDELGALPAPWQVTELRVLHVPFVDAHRCAVVLRRAS